MPDAPDVRPVCEILLDQQVRPCTVGGPGAPVLGAGRDIERQRSVRRSDDPLPFVGIRDASVRLRTGGVPPRSYRLAHWAICQTGFPLLRPKRIVSVLVFSNPPLFCTIAGQSGEIAMPLRNCGSPSTSLPFVFLSFVPRSRGSNSGSLPFAAVRQEKTAMAAHNILFRIVIVLRSSGWIGRCPRSRV